MARSAALLLALIFITASVIKVNPVSAPSAIENTWTTKAPIPQEVGSVRAAVVNGKIYVMGGSSNYEYDPETDNWVAKTPMPTPRWHFGIAVYQNKIYTIGAWESSCANEVYDPSTDTWETKEPMPTNRSGVFANVVNDKIHLIGTDSHDVYDIATDSWTSKEPPPLYQFGSVVVDGKIYTFGWNQTRIYDPISDSWSLGASPPNPVSSAGVCATTGVMASKRIYVIGGMREWIYILWSGNTQVYDPVNDTWTLGAPMLTARYGLTVAVVNDQIYAIGGAQGMYSPLSANEQYTPFGYGTPDPSYDGTPPEITLISPENKTYHKTSIPLEFSVNEPVSWMRYNLDNENFTEISGNTTLTGLSFGSHNLTVYATDDAGNMGVCQTIHFKVEEPFPTTLVIAFVTSVAVIGVGLLVYFKKRKR